MQNAEPAWILYAASFSRVLPPIALGIRRARPIPGRRWAAVACVILIIGDWGARLLGAQGINNLWVGYISSPAVGIATLFALVSWQRSPAAARRVRLLAPLFAAVWIVMLFGEDLDNFSVIAFPIQAVLLLVLCLWTLVANALGEGTQDLLRQDWFWICGGLALSNGAASAIEPLSALFLQSAPERLFDLFNFKAGVDLAASLAITRGMLCPLPTARSGPSTSSAH